MEVMLRLLFGLFCLTQFHWIPFLLVASAW